MKNIKIGKIDYINVEPIYFKIKNKKYNIISRPPSELNKMLEKKKIQISAISSSAYARNFEKWIILPDLSVSCFGNVLSVIFVSKIRVDKLNKKKIIISNESQTAFDLLKMFLFSKNIKPIFVQKKNIFPYISNPGILGKLFGSNPACIRAAIDNSCSMRCFSVNSS